MLTLEDVLASLSGRGRWFDTGTGDKRNKRNLLHTGDLRKLEDALHEIRGEKKEKGAAKLPRNIETADGTDTRNKLTGDNFTPALADAVLGMPGIEWAAIEWIVDGNQRAKDKLESRLLALARRSQDNDDFWPVTLRRADGVDGRKASTDYVPDLVRLAIMDLRFPNTFETQHARATWFGITDRHWRRLMLKPYGLLQVRTQAWLGGGCGHITRRLAASRRSE